MMKRALLRTVLVLLLYLSGMFPGDLQEQNKRAETHVDTSISNYMNNYTVGCKTHKNVSCFPVQRRGLFPIKEVTLDMALTSFDDQYKGCTEMMEAELEELNRTEFATNRVYAEAWETAASLWSERKASAVVPKGLKPEQAIAVLAYTVQGPFHKNFNTAVREAGRNRDHYLNHFHFKAFHFLLTRALHVLGAASSPRCQKVYRGVRDIRFTWERHQPVRFGHFTSSSLKNESALQFGKDTFFTIETCHGVNIKNFSSFPGEEEILIPPSEKFKVANFTKAPDTTFIQLLSLEDASVYNCVWVKEKRCLSRRRCHFNSAATSLSQFCAHTQAPFLLWGVLLAASSSTLGSLSLL